MTIFDNFGIKRASQKSNLSYSSAPKHLINVLKDLIRCQNYNCYL